MMLKPEKSWGDEKGRCIRDPTAQMILCRL